ncbi:MAG: SDR family NAD(P)-dependent oxidoreductase [bacterium]|jgi:2-keto-3-deoxy-L-fuconate dehydrogenase
MAQTFFSLNGKTAVITGAGSGIGKAIASVFAQAGAAVWIAELRDDAGERTAEEIRCADGNAWFLKCDVTQSDSIEQAVSTVLKKDGRIDILVNNAGIGFVGDVMNTPEADYDRLMEVNAKGVYLMSRGVLPHMLQQGKGNIINMASIASLIAVKDRFAYCASKGAVLMMTRAIAMDYVEQGIRCNCICPTRIHTPFVDAYLKRNYPGREQEVFEQLSRYQPIGRMGTPEEVAYMALFLASDESSLVTGAALPVDGGKLMG